MSYKLYTTGSNIDRILKKVDDGYQAGEGITLNGTTFSVDTTWLDALIKDIVKNYTPVNIAVAGLTLDSSSLIIDSEATQSIKGTINPENATNLTINWSNSNSSAITLASSSTTSGEELKFTAKTIYSDASAIITGATEDGNYQQSCIVKVNKKIQSPTAISLNKSSMTLAYNGTATLTISYTPSYSNTNKTIAWSSSDTNVVTVASNGLVKSVTESGGTATITATSQGGLVATCAVTVTAKPAEEKVYMGNILVGAAPEDPTDLATVLTDEIIKSNIDSDALKLYNVSNVLSVANGSVFTTTNGIMTQGGTYNYHTVLIPSSIASKYEGAWTDDVTHSVNLFSDDQSPFVSIVNQDVTYSGATYKMYAYYVKKVGSANQYEITLKTK